MIKQIKDWLREENKKADERLDAVVMGIFDTLIRKPVLNAMVYEMRRAEHECRVNLYVHEDEKGVS